MKTTKVLLVLTSVIAVCSVVLAAQSAGQPVAADGITLDLKTWTPATVLAVCSVVFAFGVSYNTIRVHGKILNDFKDWRLTTVDATLLQHAAAIGELKGMGKPLPPPIKSHHKSGARR